jgi:hypothetical protein
MMLSFFEVYIRNKSEYRPFLQSAYAEYISQGQDFKTHLITEKSSDSLNQSIDKFVRDNRLEVPENR